MKLSVTTCSKSFFIANLHTYSKLLVLFVLFTVKNAVTEDMRRKLNHNTFHFIAVTQMYSELFNYYIHQIAGVKLITSCSHILKMWKTTYPTRFDIYRIKKRVSSQTVQTNKIEKSLHYPKKIKLNPNMCFRHFNLFAKNFWIYKNNGFQEKIHFAFFFNTKFNLRR